MRSISSSMACTSQGTQGALHHITINTAKAERALERISMQRGFTVADLVNAAACLNESLVHDSCIKVASALGDLFDLPIFPGAFRFSR